MLDTEKYCDACKAELGLGPKLVFAVDDEDEEEKTVLCPVCGQNYIKEGEEMCDKCREERDFKAGDIDMEQDEEWREYLDDDKPDEEESDPEYESLNKLAEEEGETLFDDEEEDDSYYDDRSQETKDDEDDFEILPVDAKDFEEEDDEDDEKEDEDDEDY